MKTSLKNIIREKEERIKCIEADIAEYTKAYNESNAHVVKRVFSDAYYFSLKVTADICTVLFVMFAFSTLSSSFWESILRSNGIDIENYKVTFTDLSVGFINGGSTGLTVISNVVSFGILLKVAGLAALLLAVGTILVSAMLSKIRKRNSQINNLSNLFESIIKEQKQRLSEERTKYHDFLNSLAGNGAAAGKPVETK